MPLDAATQVTIDGQQAFAMVGTVLWTMLRTGAMLMAAPIIGTTALSKRVRVILAAALAMAIAPMLPPAPSIFVWDAAAVLGVAREILLGAAIGFMLRLAFEAGALAGELISQGTGLAFAQMSDPLRGVNSGVISTWFYLVFGLLFFAFNGHLALITTLVDRCLAVHEHEHGLQQVVAIRTAPGNVQKKIELGRGRHVIQGLHGEGWGARWCGANAAAGRRGGQAVRESVQCAAWRWAVDRHGVPSAVRRQCR